MKILERIEILANGRIQVKTQNIGVLELNNGITREVDHGTHRLAYNPGEVIGDDGGDGDFIDENGLLQKAIESIPKNLKLHYFNECLTAIKVPDEVDIPKLSEEPTDKEIKALKQVEIINGQRVAMLAEKKLYEDKIKALG